MYLARVASRGDRTMQFYPEEKNVGGWDRALRLVVGPVLVLVAVAAALGAIALSPIVVGASGVVGAILTVTGITQKCPMNSLLDLDTYRGTSSDETDVETEVTERPA